MKILTINDRNRFVLIRDDVFVETDMGDGQTCSWIPIPQAEPLLSKQREELKKIFFPPKLMSEDGK